MWWGFGTMCWSRIRGRMEEPPAGLMEFAFTVAPPKYSVSVVFGYPAPSPDARV
jgi:hypothetical protein